MEAAQARWLWVGRGLGGQGWVTEQGIENSDGGGSRCLATPCLHTWRPPSPICFQIYLETVPFIFVFPEFTKMQDLSLRLDGSFSLFWSAGLNRAGCFFVTVLSRYQRDWFLQSLWYILNLTDLFIVRLAFKHPRKALSSNNKQQFFLPGIKTWVAALTIKSFHCVSKIL
jgi:hypothetical protein